MAVVINEFEAVADNGAPAKAGGGNSSNTPVTSQARLMRNLVRVAARQNRLRAS
jgi:hypothetical protein